MSYFFVFIFTEVKVLLGDGIRKLQYNGLQRQAILDVVNSGTEAITDPNNAFQLLLSSGVIPNNTDDVVRTANCLRYCGNLTCLHSFILVWLRLMLDVWLICFTQVRQRKEILTTLLLHTHSEFIVNCIWQATKTVAQGNHGFIKTTSHSISLLVWYP